MADRITPATNIASLIALRQAQRNGSRFAGSLVPLATGSRINRGADDPAGLIASENLRASLAQIDAEQRALDRDAMVVNVADSALAEVSSLTTDLGSAAVAAANTGGMSDAEREAYQLEADSALQTIDRIASTTRFNGQAVFGGEMTITVGGDSITVGDPNTHKIGQVSGGSGAYSLADVGAGRALSFVGGDPEVAQQSIRAAASGVATMRGALGAFQRNGIESQRRAEEVAYENTAAANSAIRDTDFAFASGVSARSSALLSASMVTLRAANENGRRALNFLA